MKKKKRTINKFMTSAISASVATSAIVAFPLGANAAAANFKDVPTNKYFYEGINSLHSRNIIKGYEDGTFRPYEIITRAQAATMIARTLNLDTTNAKDPGFKDVPKESWAYKYISALANKGIIVGNGGEFKPNDALTRGQMAKIISLAYNLKTGNSQQLPFTDVKQGDWFSDYVSALINNEITTGTTPITFSPNQYVTRGQIASLIYRSENRKNPVQINETISNITKESLITSKGIYTLSNDQKKWINPSNLAALKGAAIKLTSSNNQIEKIQLIELNAKGSLSTDPSNPYANHVVFDGKGTAVDANITVNGDYFTMKNMTIKGDLHVGKGVKNSFFSEFTKVEGKTTIDDFLQSGNQLKAMGFKAAAINETAARGRVVFSEFKLGDVSVNKNADVIFLSKTSGTSLVGEITVHSNLTLTADQSVTLPKVNIAEGAKVVTLNSKISTLQVTTTGEVTLSGKSDITNLSVTTNSNVALQTIGTVGTLQTVNKGTKITLGTETKVGNLVLPSGSKPADVIKNYESVKGNVEKVGGTKNPDATPSNNNSGGSSSGENSTPSIPEAQLEQSQALDPSRIYIANFETTGPDMLQVLNVSANSTIKVYDAKKNGQVIGSFTTTQAENAFVQIPNGFAQGLDKVYVSITEAGKTESRLAEKEVPTLFPDAPAPSNITVTNNPTGNDTVTVIIPSSDSDYLISVYDLNGHQLSNNLVSNETNGLYREVTAEISNGFADELTEIDVAIVKISDNRTQYAEGSRTRVNVPPANPVEPLDLSVLAADDPYSNDKTVITTDNPDIGNEFAYKVFDSSAEANLEKPAFNDNVASWTSLPSDGKIPAANGKVVVIVERTIADKLAKKVGQTTAVTVVNNQLLEAVMLDGKDGVSSQDGKAETIRLKLSANIDPSTVANDSFTVDGFDVESIKVTDKNGRTPLLTDGITSNPLYTQGENKYITIRVTPKSGTDFAPMVIQNPNSVITDINGVQITGIIVQAKDQAAPVIISSDFIDNGNSGVNAGDQLKIAFSEDIHLVNGNSSADLANDFTLNNSGEFAFSNSDIFSIAGNLVTVTLGAETAAKLSHSTTITMSSNGNDISLVDSVGNKAKPQKEFVSETEYSKSKTIEIAGIPDYDLAAIQAVNDATTTFEMLAAIESPSLHLYNENYQLLEDYEKEILCQYILDNRGTGYADRNEIQNRFDDIISMIFEDWYKMVPDIQTFNIGYENGDSRTSVTQNVSLPTTGSVNGSNISWSSSNESVISNNGTVTRPVEDTTVILTATFTNRYEHREISVVLTVKGTGVVQDITPPTIVEAKLIKNADGLYNKVQLKFSENISDATVKINDFKISGSNGQLGQTGVGNFNTFSTERADGEIDTDATNDEYITLSFSQKDHVTNLSYTQGNLTDLAGNKLATNSNITLSE